MARPVQDVTDAELAVLQALWDFGSASRRQLTDRLYAAAGPSMYTTVQKLLERLRSKGCVRQDRRQGLVTFTATVTRDDLISRRLLAVAEKLCDGSLTPLFVNLVRAKRLTAQELSDLRGLLAELKQPPKPRGKQR